jgi:hypothetical protein
MSGENLLGPAPTLLPEEPEVKAALAEYGQPTTVELAALAAAHPRSPLAWALLADSVWGIDAALPSYAYARVGYHRGLDALRGAGWRGQGVVPWSHEPNRGFLLSLYALRRAAAAIGETDEVERLTTFLNSSDNTAIDAIERFHEDALPPTASIVILGED